MRLEVLACTLAIGFASCDVPPAPADDSAVGGVDHSERGLGTSEVTWDYYDDPPNYMNLVGQKVRYCEGNTESWGDTHAVAVVYGGKDCNTMHLDGSCKIHDDWVTCPTHLCMMPCYVEPCLADLHSPVSSLTCR